MKAHVQNPWTRSPSLMVNMTVEEVQQLRFALSWCLEMGADEKMSANQRDAFGQLYGTLQHVLTTALPHGIKGVLP